MKTYDKEKLHEYAKELFALCWNKNLLIHSKKGFMNIFLSANEVYTTYTTEELFNLKVDNNTMPIWELIEKVKSL